MDLDLERLRSIAEVWRLSRLQAGRAGEIGRLGGVVLIREGEVCGVLSEMRFAAVEPGLFAVDEEGRVFTVESCGRFSAPDRHHRSFALTQIVAGTSTPDYPASWKARRGSLWRSRRHGIPNHFLPSGAAFASCRALCGVAASVDRVATLCVFYLCWVQGLPCLGFGASSPELCAPARALARNGRA